LISLSFIAIFANGQPSVSVSSVNNGGTPPTDSYGQYVELNSASTALIVECFVNVPSNGVNGDTVSVEYQTCTQNQYTSAASTTITTTMGYSLDAKSILQNPLSALNCALLRCHLFYGAKDYYSKPINVRYVFAQGETIDGSCANVCGVSKVLLTDNGQTTLSNFAVKTNVDLNVYSNGFNANLDLSNSDYYFQNINIMGTVINPTICTGKVDLSLQDSTTLHLNGNFKSNCDGKFNQGSALVAGDFTVNAQNVEINNFGIQANTVTIKEPVVKPV